MKYLGLHVIDKSVFSSQISNVICKVYYIISRLAIAYFLIFNKNAKEGEFTSVILPVSFMYAVSVWYHFILQENKDKI